MKSILWPPETMRIIDVCELRVLHWIFTLHCPRSPAFLRNNPMAIHCLVSFLSSLSHAHLRLHLCQGTLLAKPPWEPENLGAQGCHVSRSGGNMVLGEQTNYVLHVGKHRFLDLIILMRQNMHTFLGMQDRIAFN